MTLKMVTFPLTRDRLCYIRQDAVVAIKEALTVLDYNTGHIV